MFHDEFGDSILVLRFLITNDHFFYELWSLISWTCCEYSMIILAKTLIRYGYFAHVFVCLSSGSKLISVLKTKAFFLITVITFLFIEILTSSSETKL